MNNDLFEGLVKGIREAGKVKRGEKRASRVTQYSPLDVKKIRKDMGLSQYEFSQLALVNIKTLQNWEQGRRQPQGPALALLTILKNDPNHAINALQSDLNLN